MAATKKKTAGGKSGSASKKAAPAKKQPERETSSHVTYAVVTAITAILLGVFMFVDTGSGGIVSGFVKSVLCGVFGIMAYFLPAVMAGLSVYLIKYRNTKKFWVKLCLVMLAVVNIGAFIALSGDVPAGDAYGYGAMYHMGGGLFGGYAAAFMEEMVQKVAAYIIFSVTLLVLLSFIMGMSLIRAGINYARRVAAEMYETYEGLADEREERQRQKRERIRQAELDEERCDALNAANEFAADTAGAVHKKKAGTRKVIEDEPVADEEIFSDGIDEVFGDLPPAQPIIEDKPTEKTTEKPAEEKADKITEQEKQEFHKELNDAIEKQHIEYKYPPISLLNKTKPVSGDQREEMRRTAEKLIAVLSTFGVKAKLLQVTQGPTVTRYEIQPDAGIKLSKIVGLADDIALNLAVTTVLIAPVPGKAAVGVEIPNKKVASVSIREMIASDEFKKAKSKLTVALGKDIGGNVVIGDIAKMPHVLIAGATGSGKSVCINTIITSILFKASPEDVRLIMVDPKVVELGVYNGIPHLLIPVVTDPKKAAGALNWAVAEMMRRYELFKETGVRKLESYNKLMESEGGDKVPQIVIIIDELADLMMVAAKEVEDYIVRLTQLARAAGIHLIIATQRPSVDVITGLIKANVPSRIAFAVSSQVDSRTIIDKGGAEKLLGMGDMLYFPMGARAATRVQGAFVSDPEIENILEFIKENSGENHYSEDLAEHIERVATGENGVTPDTEEDGDPLLQDAIQLAVELGKISTSMVQRRLGVGYSRAGRIIDQMEARGIISGANVLVSHADFPSGDYYDDSEE